MFSLMGNCISSVKKRRQPKKPITLALLGVDNAGKTTASHSFSGQSIDPDVAPTIGFRSVKFPFDNYDITIFDIGGGKNIRPVWKNYFPEVYGVIYMVDSSTTERMNEARETLQQCLEHANICGKPLLVLANKQDKPDALDEVDICELLNLETVVNINKCLCRIIVCSAISGSGRKMDPRMREGLRWLLAVIEKQWGDLRARVERDVQVLKETEKAEAAARKERVRKMREEREREEEEERQRLGIQKKESDDEEVIDGDPFKPLDISKLKKKEEALKAEKKHRNELEEAAKNKDDFLTQENGGGEKIISARLLPPLVQNKDTELPENSTSRGRKKKKKKSPRDANNSQTGDSVNASEWKAEDKSGDNGDVSAHTEPSHMTASDHLVMTVSNIQVSTHDDFPSRQLLAAGVSRVPSALDGQDQGEDISPSETPRTRRLKKKRLRQLGASLGNVNDSAPSPRALGGGGGAQTALVPSSKLTALDGGDIENMSGARQDKKTKKKGKKNRLAPSDEEKYHLAPLSIIGGSKAATESEQQGKPPELSGMPRHSQMHSNISLESDPPGSRTWAMAEDLPAVADNNVAPRQPNFNNDVIL